MVAAASPSAFFGWRVVTGAFVMAIFGWGLGFYGPPVYLHAVKEARGWSVGLISAAVTVHYLSGAVVVANLPRLYRRFGLVAVTRTGVVLLAFGLAGWALAERPWQLFAATLLTGCGWVTLGAAAINAIIAPWFVQLRPRALAMAYNGASVGGVIFSPLWVALIGWVGFLHAALFLGGLSVIVVFLLTASVIGKTPEQLGQQPDGERSSGEPHPAAPVVSRPAIAALRSDLRFLTLAAGMALGLFAQIGLLAHLFSLIVPPLGAGPAGLIAGLATAAAVLGRTVFGWWMPAQADRRNWAAACYAVQLAGIGIIAASGLQSPSLIVAGMLLFGFGIGNATSLPPLIAQSEFTKLDAARVVPLIVAVSQASYAFAPAIFGLVRDAAAPASLPLFAGAATVMALAMLSLLVGRQKRGAELHAPDTNN